MIQRSGERGTLVGHCATGRNAHASGLVPTIQTCPRTLIDIGRSFEFQ